jgi:hypothetical protein
MNDKDSSFQNVISILGLVAAFITAMIPLFSQSELGRFFVDTSFVVPITILTIIIGIPLSWNIIENYKIVMIPVKKRGSERPGYIVSRHIVWILIVLTTVLLVLFFVARELRWQPYIQYIIYPVFFLNLFATFSLLLASAMERSRYENDQATTPYRILRTLERNGLVQPRIKVIENMIEQDSDFIQTKLNIQNEPGVRLVTVEVDGERISAILTHDLSQLLRKIEPSNNKEN